jgi:hypothetical protein
MSAIRRRTYVSSYLIPAIVIVGSSSLYAVESASSSRQIDGGDVIITEDEKPAFLAYAKRQNMRPASSIDRTSVGDVLPRFGIAYYILPLRFGSPSYRCAAVGTQIIIVDRSSGVVVQVLG